MSDNGLNYVGQLFDNYGKLKDWEIIREDFNLENKLHFAWIQLIDSIPTSWKKKNLNDRGNSKNLCIFDNHLIKKSQIYIINKLNSRELYRLQNYCDDYKPTSQIYFESFFDTILDWKAICLMPRKVTVDTVTRIFQYKIINNILYLNKKLYIFKKVFSPLCSFCNSHDETILHIFFECTVTQNLWKQLCLLLRHNLIFPDLTPQSAIFGFLECNNNGIIMNHILLVFKLYVYKCRESGAVNIQSLKSRISQIRNTEEIISKSSTQKHKKFRRKWDIVKEIFS